MITTTTAMPRLLKHARVLALAALTLFAALGAVGAQEADFRSGGTSAATAPASGVTIAELLERGRELETQARWGEALAIYEDALRQFPREQAIEQRFGLTRLHYDLARRYSDSSFGGLVGRLSAAEALNLYSEVLLKIQSHYVELPDWSGLVAWGTSALEVALTEPTYLASHALTSSAEEVNRFRTELRSMLAARTIASREAARQAVMDSASLAHQRLGLAPGSVVLEYVCGATSSLDPYSAYLTPSQLTDVYSQIEGNFVGLGIELKADAGSLVIVRVIAGSPAERGGVLAGDRIVAVDGKPTKDITTDQAANLLQGPEGSWATLVLASPGGPSRQLVMRREQVDVPSVDGARIVDPQRGIAYLKITCFQKTTSRDLDTALWNLQRSGMQSLIIDLRGNPGGLLVAAVEVADKFIKQGTIVSTHGRAAQEDFTYTAHDVGTWGVPLAVLIDGDSASAAEIFAGAIRDHRRGTLLGVRSYGKGSVQGIFPLGIGNSGMRLTTAKFYSPTGRAYSMVGVEPDVLVRQVARPVEGPAAAASSAGAADLGQDPVVAAALEAIPRAVAQR